MRLVTRTVYRPRQPLTKAVAVPIQRAGYRLAASRATASRSHIRPTIALSGAFYIFARERCSVLFEIRGDVRSVLDATRARLYYLAALKAACNLAASSCETEVFKILPPIPFSSFSTLSLSGDGLLTSTKRAEPPGISVPANSFMN